MATSPYYNIDKDNQPIIELIIAWMCNDPTFCKSKLIKNEPSLSKGICLLGNPGSGKSLLIKAMSVASKKFFDKDYIKRFDVKYCDAIELEYHKVGPESMDKYRNKIWGGQKNNLAFDELGYEDTVKRYGNEAKEVMADVLMVRDRLFTDHGLFTHFTSNLHIDNITERYGDRADSRLNGMCNIIYLGSKQDSIDYRKYKF